MTDNPLSAAARKPQKQHPMMMHAMMWKHVAGMHPDSLEGKITQTDALLPILGGLAGNPNVKSKDVIKAAAGAAGDGIVAPDEAVKFITMMPSDPEKLQGWLRGIYAANLSAAVHMKAAALQGAQPQPQAPQQPQQSPQPNPAIPPNA